MVASPKSLLMAQMSQGVRGPRGALKRELILCVGRALRAPRARSRRKTWAHVTPEALISERPAEEDRAIPGHWEGDLPIELEPSAIGTVVDCTTRVQVMGILTPTSGESRLGPGPAGSARQRSIDESCP